MTRRTVLRNWVMVLAGLSVVAGSADAKDSRTLKLTNPCQINGKALPAGEYTLSWVSHSPQATLTLTRGKEAVVTFQGKWVERDVKYERNMIVYDTKPDGSMTVVEIRLAGMRQALVIGTTAPGSSKVLIPRAEPARCFERAPLLGLQLG